MFLHWLLMRQVYKADIISISPLLTKKLSYRKYTLMTGLREKSFSPGRSAFFPKAEDVTCEYHTESIAISSKCWTWTYNAAWVGQDTPQRKQGNWRAKLAIRDGGKEPLTPESAMDKPVDLSEDVPISKQWLRDEKYALATPQGTSDFLI